MTTIRTRPYPDDGAAAAGGLLAAGRITLAAVAAGGVTADRAPHGEPALAPPGRARPRRSPPGRPRTAGGVVTYAATVRPAPARWRSPAAPPRFPGAVPSRSATLARPPARSPYPNAGAYEIIAAYSGDALPCGQHVGGADPARGLPDAAARSPGRLRHQRAGHLGQGSAAGRSGYQRVRARHYGHGHRRVAQPFPRHRAARHPHRREPGPVALLSAHHQHRLLPGRQLHGVVRRWATTRLPTRPRSWCRDPPGRRARTSRRHHRHRAGPHRPAEAPQPPSRRPLAAQATTAHHQLSRHEEAHPTQPRDRHRPLNRSGPAWSCRGSPAAI